MNLNAYARFLHKKINSAHIKAKNPFFDSKWAYNPFNKPIYTTVVWVEPEEGTPNEFKDFNNL